MATETEARTASKRTARILLECILVTARKRSLGQVNIFTPVCHSVHGGGLPQCMLGPPGTRHPPRTRHPPPQPGPGTPPGAEHAGRYAQRAGGTHPTGIQSC